MGDHLDPTGVVVLLQTHTYDLTAHVEAASRCVREVQRHIATLKESGEDDERADALHAIRENASVLLVENDGFCATLREVQLLAARLSPERRRTHQCVMWDRRRRA